MKPFQPWSPGRLVAVDHGSRSVKMLLVEAEGAAIKVVGHKSVDLLEEGLLAEEEIQRQVASLLEAWAEWPVAVTLPAHLSFAQVLDLPAGGESDIPKVIEEQTGRLRGLLRHVHISENDRSTPGQGNVRWKENFDTLREVGYNGWMTIEAFGLALPELAAATKIWRRMFASEEQLARDGLAFMKSEVAKRWATC